MFYDFSKVTNKLFLFYSIDLVDSTLMKSILKDKWQNILFDFMSELIAIQYRLNRAESFNLNIFKTLGDEIIFFSMIDDYKKINEIFLSINSSVLDLQEKYLNTKKSVRIKNTSWIIHTKDNYNLPIAIDVQKNKIANKDAKKSKMLDFIGPQMDEGFRVAGSFSKCGQTALSLELAYFLLENQNECNISNSYVYYLGLKDLKGVWNGKKYPILWFSDNFERSLKFMNYEQREYCELSKKFISIVNDNSEDINMILNNIINDNYLNDLKKRIESMKKII